MNIGSAHAGACFVRVGRGRLDSLLGSILESFWGPSSPLYSFLVDLGCKLVEKKGSQKKAETQIIDKIRLTLSNGGVGPSKSTNQRVQKPTMDPLTLHFVPWGHGGGFI